ncbi:hypothetical protein [Pedosphaera parvula]|uniref:Uncharacterized protein n=1 Tax=Pedosphaera parvula (strain Ellin514) TaxID=320771 RepID=B9XFB2_PEDPL|nr:hypothetical protein [Pedosphaera parvula]EEF61610.1 hypothetical protein Cflav_PD4289 [Pedosphaera parvula Ellin514]
MTHPMLGFFNLGGAEIILILAIMFVMSVMLAGAVALVFIIIKITQRRSDSTASAAIPPKFHQP